MIEKDKIEELILKYTIVMQMIISKLNIIIKEYEFKNKYNIVEHIKYRIKNEESAFDKLRRKGYEVSIENLKEYVHDMIGIRVVCSFISDVYEIVNLIKKEKDIVIIEERDYIKSPKKSGYQSYHLIIKVPIILENKREYLKAEIQVRTIAMDFWASIDHKIQYKFENLIPQNIKDEMFNCSKIIQELDKKIHSLNENVKKYNNL